MKKFSSITRVNSHRISQTKKRWQIVVITLVCIALLLLIPALMRGAASLIVAPVVVTKDWFLYSTGSFPQYLRNRTELIKEIDILKSELSAIVGAEYSIQQLKDENERLRKLMDEEETRVIAAIIARPGQLPYDTIMLDRGTDHGVQEGAPVFIGDNTVVGIVRSAAAGTAIVELMTSPGFETTVFIMGPDIYTNAVGVGGGQMRVGVPQGIPLNQGDLVVLPSIYSGVYGEIGLVQSVPTRPEQYGFVSPEIPLLGMRYVSVGAVPMEKTSFEEAQAILEEIHEDYFVVPVPEGILVELDGATGTSTPTTTEAVIEEEAE